MTEYNDDPFASAEDPQVRQAGDIFGQAVVNVWYAVLEKGTGKLPFNAQIHKPEQRVTVIDTKIENLAEHNLNFPMERSQIAESRDWAGITLPSIKDLGLSLRELNGKWVRVSLEQTGRTYVNKSGETRNTTVFKFKALFQSEAECRAAYHTEYGQAAPAIAAPAATGGNGNGNGSAERVTAEKFLKPIVDNAARGQTDFEIIKRSVAASIAIMPLVSKHFTVDSPEVLQLIAEAMKVPF